MAKKNHGRRRQPQRRSPNPRTGRQTHDDGAPGQELFQGLRRALRADDPLDLLAEVSGMLEVTDPRARDPFAKSEAAISLDDLVESFIGTPYAETTAALMAIKVLITDELMQARISRELAQRRHPLPDWLTSLARAHVETDVWFLTHVLRDGDDYLFGVTLPSGHSLSALVYVDHNLGTVVKDAFVVPETLEDLALKVGTTMDDPDQSLTRTDPATARALIEEAIERGSRVYPPIVSDSWPVCRPLVEWMLRLLPGGGVVPEPQELTPLEQVAVLADFFASPYGVSLDHEDERALLETLLWFATDYANREPFLWSPVTVELLLEDWFPRKVRAETAYLAKLPHLLRAFIRYSHHRVGVRDDLTATALRAVDHYEPGYQRVIRSERHQGPAALVAQLLTGRDDLHDFDDFDDFDDFEDFDEGKFMLERLARAVGGRMVLQALDATPLPDEPFEWAGIADDIHPVVSEYVDLCDRCADELLDVEHRTAMRRFLSRAAAQDPKIFRRRASPARGAAAIAWVICQANDTIGAHRSLLTVKELVAWFGVDAGISQRAHPFLRANGVDPYQIGPLDLGAPDLLTAAQRAAIIEVRDRWQEA